MNGWIGGEVGLVGEVGVEWKVEYALVLRSYVLVGVPVMVLGLGGLRVGRGACGIGGWSTGCSSV